MKHKHTHVFVYPPGSTKEIIITVIDSFVAVLVVSEISCHGDSFIHSCGFLFFFVNLRFFPRPEKRY